MNQKVYESTILRSNFIVRAIPISYLKKLDDMGKWEVGKFIKIIGYFFRLFYELVFFRPRFVYFQISPHGIAFYRDLLFIVLIKIFHVKIVFHLHGKGLKDNAKKYRIRKLYTFSFRGEDVICLSNLLTYDVNGFFKGKIHIVNNGIPDISNRNLQLHDKSNQKIINILYLSNLIKSKGILDFLNALEILKQEGYSFKANVVGAESDLTQEELIEIIRNKRLEENICYLGAKYGEEKEKIFSNSNVLVFPTKNDVWGNVILEAMQHSIPVIATIEGAIPEIIDDGVTGYLVEKNCPHNITDKLIRLIKNPEHCKAMGREGRKKYKEKYTLSVFEQNMKNVFNDVLDNLI